MSINQLNFNNQDKVMVAISRLKEYEPSEGYYLAFSGGKDSITIYDLAIKAGVKFDAHYNMTGIDPPELVKLVRSSYPQVEIHRPPTSIYKEVIKRGLPHRKNRWCCAYLKEYTGDNRVIVTGIRWQESSRRKLRKLYEPCSINKTKLYLHPIIDWSNNEVWEYILENDIPYCSLYNEGFTRIGCVMCPIASKEIALRDMNRFPKMADNWRRAAIRFCDSKKDKIDPNVWLDGEELFKRWANRQSIYNNKSIQYLMFDN